MSAVTTKEKLLAAIEKFLAAHPELPEPSFGHKAIKDTCLVKRLREGGDITTKKLDIIIEFMQNYKQTGE